MDTDNDGLGFEHLGAVLAVRTMNREPWTRGFVFWNTLGTILGAVSGLAALGIVLFEVLAR